MKYINLDSYMGSDYTNWIFDKIDIPTDDDAELVNILYSGHSGEKWISPLCLKLNGDEEVATDDTKNTLSKLIKAKYLESWKRLYNALFADYNPIENYALKEEEITDRDITDSGTNSNTTDTTNTGKETNTNNTKTDTTNSNTNSENGNTLNQVYAEDSNDPVNASKQINENGSTSSGSGNTTSEGSETTDTTHTGKETNTGTHANTGTEDTTKTLTRSGNIGVTTSQQMIESEIALRKHNYYDIIFKDIDNLLCLSIY